MLPSQRREWALIQKEKKISDAGGIRNHDLGNTTNLGADHLAFEGGRERFEKKNSCKAFSVKSNTGQEKNSCTNQFFHSPPPPPPSKVKWSTPLLQGRMVAGRGAFKPLYYSSRLSCIKVVNSRLVSALPQILIN